MRRSHATKLSLLTVLFIEGCRVPTEGFREKAVIPSASVGRVVLLTTEPGPEQDCFFETRDPRLIARLVEGLRSASRPRGETTLEGLSPLYVVPKTGRPLYFGIVLARVEHLYGTNLASPIKELLKKKPVPYDRAAAIGRTDLIELKSKAR